MSFARDVYTATGGQTDFTISFTYLDDAHITVTQEGSALTETTHYTFPNATTVRLVTGATVGDTVVISRTTSQNTRLVDYTAGVLVESDLDNDSLQAFYMAQEAIDTANISLGKDASELWDAESIRITNVGTPTATTDAVTKAYVDNITTVAGNVPTPVNPTDDNKLLTASAGSFSWQDPAGALASLDTVDTAQIDASAIETAKINDNAVTLAKMEHGTSGDTLYYGASGVPTRLAKGSDDEVLTLASGLPSWAAPATSEWVYDKRTAMSGVQDIDFTMDSGYDYKFILREIAPGTDSVNLMVRYSTDGGTVFSEVSYSWLLSYRDPTATESHSGDTSDTEHSMGSQGSATNEKLWGEMVVLNPGASDYTKHMYHSVMIRTSDSAMRTLTHQGRWESTTAVDAIRFRVSSGVWSATGSIDVYKRTVQ